MTGSGDRINNDASDSRGGPPVARPPPEGDTRNISMIHPLPNGTSILIRAVRPDDKARFRAAFGNLERDSIFTRFFGYKKGLTEAELQQATDVDFDRVVALVATIGSGEAETIIAGARYVSDPEPGPHKRAEVAFTVEEDYQGQGIAGCLLDCLIRIARARGLTQFDADVLTSNWPMLAVFARSGLPIQKQQLQDVVHVTLML